MSSILLRAIAFLVASFSVFTAAQASWRSEIGIFRIGVATAEQPASFKARAEPFRTELQKALKMEVEFFTARNTEALIDAMHTERIEYAIMSTSAYALAWHLCECVEPMVVPKTRDSTNSYHAVIISRQGGIKSVKDLVGKSVGELAPGSFVQSHLVKNLLTREGVDLESLAFASSGSGEQTLREFSEGTYDVLIGWSSMSGFVNEGFSRGTLRRIAADGKSDVKDYKIIWESPSIPHRPHVIRKRLPGEAKEILQSTLLAMFDKAPVAYDSIEPTYGGGFSRANHKKFEFLLGPIKALSGQEKTIEDAVVEETKETAPVSSE